ncbi:MAG: BlaI/MecI/CopY family transcriptional regulator [Myxococcota bacterium]
MWRTGRGTVRDVLAELPPSATSPTPIVATMLRILEQKGFATSTSEGRKLVYAPTVERGPTSSAACATWSTARSAATPARCCARWSTAPSCRRAVRRPPPHRRREAGRRLMIAAWLPPQLALVGFAAVVAAADRLDEPRTVMRAARGWLVLP